MPELPEVETIVRDLAAHVVGRKVDWIKIRLNKLVRTGPRRLTRLLTGTETLSVARKGKFIVMTFSGNRYLVVHLKMTGQFLRGGPNTPWPKHVHAGFGFTDGQVLLYRDMRQFGYFLGLNADGFEDWMSRLELGPDPFEITSEEFAARLKSRRGRIKPLLLNQKFISGLGNIYVDESLFAAGIHPLESAANITSEQAVSLHRKMTAILAKAISLRGSTTNNYVGLNGQGGQFQNSHCVYHRKGQECVVCGDILQRIVVGGRGTHFCPSCQCPQPVE